MKIVIGLGNPTKKYQNTFHNMGFMAADEIARRFGAGFDKKECGAESAHIFFEGQKAVIAKPQTFMNNSGESVLRFLDKYKLNLSDLLIIYDDIDIARGKIRIRPCGSAGTHNGMRNITERLGGGDFPRLRIGIGQPENPHIDLAGYVLSRIPSEYGEELKAGVERAASAAADFIKGADIESLMQKYNN
jgi:PTH1 family peptidyl-tRNA hydrolase